MLRRLATEGFEGSLLEELETLAAWCWDWGVASGDARFCVLWRVIGAIDNWMSSHEESGGVPLSIVSAMGEELKRRLPDILDEVDWPSAAEQATLLEQNVLAYLTGPEQWVADGLVLRPGSD
jgi:hypothetical protein